MFSLLLVIKSLCLGGKQKFERERKGRKETGRKEREKDRKRRKGERKGGERERERKNESEVKMKGMQ